MDTASSAKARGKQTIYLYFQSSIYGGDSGRAHLSHIERRRRAWSVLACLLVRI